MRKIQENVQCEIMHVIVEEARDSYRCGAARRSAEGEDEGRGGSAAVGGVGAQGAD